MTNLETVLITFIATIIFVATRFKDTYFIEKEKLKGKILTLPDNSIWTKFEVNNDNWFRKTI